MTPMLCASGSPSYAEGRGGNRDDRLRDCREIDAAKTAIRTAQQGATSEDSLELGRANGCIQVTRGLILTMPP